VARPGRPRTGRRRRLGQVSPGQHVRERVTGHRPSGVPSLL